MKYIIKFLIYIFFLHLGFLLWNFKIKSTFTMEDIDIDNLTIYYD